jgi:hypothetical protein
MINFLKFFAIFGVPFGAMMAVWRSFTHDDTLAYGVFQGVFFGVVMATWAVWWTRRNRRRLEAKGFSAGNMQPRQERQLLMSAPVDVALDACVRVLKAVPKARAVTTDMASGTAVARIGMTWRSFGERMTVTVRPEGAGSRVTISSVPLVPTTYLDGGKGSENVETVLRGLSVA